MSKYIVPGLVRMVVVVLVRMVVVVLVRMVVVVLEEEGKVGSPRLLLQAQLGSAHTLLPIPPSCQPALHTFALFLYRYR